MGPSQVLGPPGDSIQTTHRLVRFPRVDRFRFELRQVLIRAKPTSFSPIKRKWATTRRHRPDDSPRNKFSLSPPVNSQSQEDHPGVILTTQAKRQKQDTWEALPERRKHQSIATSLRSEDRSVPSVVNLTYDLSREEPRRRLRQRLLPLKGKGIKQTLSSVAAREAPLSPRVNQPAEPTPLTTPTCLTPYLPPQTTRRVIFTKEAPVIT